MIDESDAQALPGDGVTPVEPKSRDGQQPAEPEGAPAPEGGHGQQGVEQHGWDPSPRTVNRAIVIGAAAGAAASAAGVALLVLSIVH